MDSAIKDNVSTRGGLILILIRFILYTFPFGLLFVVCQKELQCMLKRKRGRIYLPLNQLFIELST
ncbi:hypothetical protein FO521_03780 [Bacillus pseudomycoides]|uniref:Uncharacterized protein n=1 Tax=Bacillus pseudomycoides TaxID=64104 RepID=A0AAJ1YUW3_9BACI|nr:hypothetical protein [Bacillus pseudomycoides]MDR4324863.1 hypothetical protein [Bacillus pseudomycoides]